MSRSVTGYWDERSRRYYTRIGEVSDATGKRAPVMLRHEDGTPVGYGDHAGKAAAIRRQLAAIRAAERRAAGPSVGDLVKLLIAWHREQGTGH